MAHPAQRKALKLAALGFCSLLGLSLSGLAPALAQNKDAVTICQTLEPPILDPSAGAAAAIREVTYANIFEGLVEIGRAHV